MALKAIFIDNILHMVLYFKKELSGKEKQSLLKKLIQDFYDPLAFIMDKKVGQHIGAYYL